MTHISDRKCIGVVLAAWSPAPTESREPPEIQPTPDLRPAVQTNSTGSTPLPAASLAVPTEQRPARPGGVGAPASRHSEGLEHLTHDILVRGGYGRIEVGYCGGGHPSLEEAIERAITASARRVVVVPTIFTMGATSHLNAPLDDLPQRVAAMQARHPGTEIVYAGPPFDRERQVDLILSKIREYEPEALRTDRLHLNDLVADEIGVVRGLDGGSHFLSRMASLGFTPGVRVKMVRNYGHGAVIVSLRGARVALGRGEALKVGVVRVTDQGQPGV